MKTTGLSTAAMAALALAGCSPEAVKERGAAATEAVEERIGKALETGLRRWGDFWIGLGETMVENSIELLGSGYEPEALPGDIEELRAMADREIRELDALFGELIAARKAVQEAHTDHWEKRWAGDAVTLAEYDRRRSLDEMRRGAASDVWRDVNRARTGARLRKMSVEAGIARARETLTALQSATRPDPEFATEAVEEIRAAVAAAVDGLDPLYDELVVVLEAIEAAHADAEEKRRARDRVTMAELARRQEMERLRGDVAAEQMFRIRSAERRVGTIRARLEGEIAEAREKSKGLRR